MTYSVLVALGSNQGNRLRWLREGVDALQDVIDVVRISSVYETEPIDAPPPLYLNLVVAATTDKAPNELLRELLAIEHRLRRTRSTRNAPRTIDLDLILHSAHVMRSRALTVPHPRYRDREFVLAPFRELGMGWIDPTTQRAIRDLRGQGAVARVARLW